MTTSTKDQLHQQSERILEEDEDFDVELESALAKAERTNDDSEQLDAEVDSDDDEGDVDVAMEMDVDHPEDIPPRQSTSTSNDNGTVQNLKTSRSHTPLEQFEVEAKRRKIDIEEEEVAFQYEDSSSSESEEEMADEGKEPGEVSTSKAARNETLDIFEKLRRKHNLQDDDVPSLARRSASREAPALSNPLHQSSLQFDRSSFSARQSHSDENVDVLYRRERSLSRNNNLGASDAGSHMNVGSKNPDQMVWARKFLFRSTELVFPGFTRQVEARHISRQLMGCKMRSSLVLQVLLYAEMLFFVAWTLSFLMTFDLPIKVLKELHGNLVMCMSMLFAIINIPRLFLGFRGNELDKLESLALFWMLTFVVQLPLFGFVLCTDIFTPVKLAYTITMDSIMMTFIVLEAIVGTIHLKRMVQDELKIIELANKSEQMMVRNENPGNYNDGPSTSRSTVERDENPNAASNLLEPDDDDQWSSEEEQELLDYHMIIRGPSQTNTEEAEVEDDTHEVSSTSDTTRRRQIPVM